VAAADRVLPPAVLAWRIAGKPVPLVLRATNHPSGNLKLWAPIKFLFDLLLSGLSRLIYRQATAVVAVSDGVADEVVRLSGLDRRDITTIFEPVVDESLGRKAREELNHPWLAPGEPPVLLGVGHLRLQKDFPTLIRAFALARAKREMRLVLLGEGGQRAELQKMVEELGVQVDVCLFGYTENPFAWMARASMFVLSSAWEGLPAVLIEALACGCPVVSTDCPSGPREILDGGKYGRLVPCFDPEALAGAILETLDALPDRESLRQRAMNFGVDASIDAYIRTFEAAIARQRGRERESEAAGVTA
jgi:glycosyltransferase involved in cell wall biosynthesis